MKKIKNLKIFSGKNGQETPVSGYPSPFSGVILSGIAFFLLCTFLVFPVTATDQGVSGPAEKDPRIIWSAQLPDDPTNHPVVVDDTVYVTYSDINFQRPTVNGLNAYFAGNGTKKWHYSISEDPNAYFETPVTVANHIAYIGGWDGSVHAVSTNTGKRLWRFRTIGASHMTNYTVQSAPAIYNNLVFFGSDDGYVYAVTALGGWLQWKVDLTGDMNVSIRGSPLIDNGTIYIGGDDRILHALDVTNGVQTWQFKAGDRVRGTMAISEEGDIVYFTAGDTLYAVSPATHDRKWVFRKQGQRLSSPVVSGNRVYITSSDDQVIAVDATSGALAWSTTVNRASVQTPVISNGILFASSKSDGANSGTITMADADSGTILGQFTAPGSFTYPVAVKDGIAYAFAACPDKDNRKTYRDYTRLYAFSVYQPPVIEWDKSFGGSNDDYAEFISRTADGGIIIGGETMSSDGDIDPAQFHGIEDIVIAKYDADSTLQWSHLYGGTNGESTLRQILSLEDGVLFIGTTSATDGDFKESGHHGTSENDDIVVMKIDRNDGHNIWTRCYGGSGNDVGMWGALTGDRSSVVIVGFSNSNDGDFAGLNKGGTDAFAMIIDLKSGEMTKARMYGGSLDDEATQIERVPGEDGFVISGFTDSNDFDVAGKNHGGANGTSDGWIFLIDKDLNLNPGKVWVYGGIYDEEFWNFQITRDGSIVVTGNANSEPSDGNIPVDKHGTAGSSDIWMLKLNRTDGSIITNHCFGGSRNDYGTGVRETEGGYFLLGTTKSSDGDVTSKHGTGDTADLWLIKVNQDSRIIYQKTFGGTMDDYGKRLGFQYSPFSMQYGYIVGTTWSDDGDVTKNYGKGDIWILKLKGASGDSLW